MSIQYFFTKMQICSCVFMNHHNVRFVPYDQVRIWAWYLLSWQHLVNPVIVLWTARSWVQVQSAGDTVLCVALGLWPPPAALQSNPLPLELFMALPLQLSHVAFQDYTKPSWRACSESKQGSAGVCLSPWGAGRPPEVNIHIYLTDKALSYHLFVEKIHPGLLLLLLPMLCPAWVRAQDKDSMGQWCRGSGTSLASALPLGGESCSPAYHCQAQLQRHFTGMVSPCLIYAACIQIVKDHPGRPFCHWNSNAFSFQPSLCFWELHAIFCDCVLPLYNPGNISQAFQWTMVLSRTVVLLLTLYC